MIDISRLTEKDKGREVVFFEPWGSRREFGIISSWNERFIFVKYNGSQQSKATYPENLRFSMEHSVCEKNELFYGKWREKQDVEVL